MSCSAFENWLIRKGLLEITISKHLKNLSYLSRVLPDWSLECADNFIIDLKKRGRRNATLNNYICTIRLYAQFLELDVKLQQYKMFKKEESLKEVLSDTEIESMLALQPLKGTNKKIFEQDQVFLACIAYTGARPSEIARLTRFDIEGNYFKIRKSKTKRPRLVPIAYPIQNMVHRFIENLNRDNLFITNRGCLYSDHNWQHIWKKRMDSLNIHRPNLTIYSLRHSMATELARRKVPSQTIAKLLGNSIEMVEKIYSHMVINDVEDALKEHPLVWKNSKPNELLKQIVDTIRAFHIDKDSRFKYRMVQTDNKISFEVEDITSPNLLKTESTSRDI